ncbi:hypothetical protein [Thiomicrorhabdus aquaedulcis]|uniref:hypothetical protein n=1 Tax=Thiomicrorhabdus aquaedulcis TaxID=2211106 RepID=UPI000FD9A8DA|nr:hypothetical protein [Thiomicrorhabdus aquaedulcis]
MKTQKIKTQGGEVFSYEDVKEPTVQKILKSAYVKKQFRMYCGCQNSNDLELVIAYRRKTELFELRKLPGQSPKSHAESCPFSMEVNKIGHALKKNSGHDFYVTLPEKENGWFSDHVALKKLHNTLLKKIHEGGVVSSWFDVKGKLLDASKVLHVNAESLAKIFNVVIPAPKEKLKPIWFQLNESRLLLGELLSAQKIPNKNSIVVHLKGTGDSIWFNRSEFLEGDEKTLLSPPAEKRVFVFCSVKKSTTGESIQGYGLSTRVLNKDFS